MKTKERQAAIALRQAGFSINEIRNRLKISKGSASLWVRDVVLEEDIVKKLKARSYTGVIAEKRRATRINNEEFKREKIIEEAEREIGKISKRELFLIGVMLYWAEGGKTQRGLVRFSNSDPDMIKIIMSFFRIICKVPEEKFRGYIHIHHSGNVCKAVTYWSEISKIPCKQFFKTYKSKKSDSPRHTIPLGTMDVYVCDTNLFLKIKGWARGIFKG